MIFYTMQQLHRLLSNSGGSVWKNMKSLCDKCFHCITTFDCRVPRPYGEALHAEERNQVPHSHFTKVEKESKQVNFKEGSYQYVLDIKECKIVDIVTKGLRYL
jgi:hypothetical protein